MFWLETALSVLMGTIGGYLLYRGKKIQEPKMMLWGGVLIVLSYFLFSGGSNDEDSKKMVNTLMPGLSEQAPDQQSQATPPEPTPTPTIQP